MSRRIYLQSKHCSCFILALYTSGFCPFIKKKDKPECTEGQWKYEDSFPDLLFRCCFASPDVCARYFSMSQTASPTYPRCTLIAHSLSQLLALALSFLRSLALGHDGCFWSRSCSVTPVVQPPTAATAAAAHPNPSYIILLSIAQEIVREVLKRKGGKSLKRK